MKKIVLKFVLIVFLLGFISLFVKGYIYNKEIEDNKVQTICKFVFCKQFPKTSESFFEYYVNNQIYRNSYGQCPTGAEKINNFFVIYYSSKDPNKIEVDFSNQITDTIAILEAGFSKADIKN